MSFLNSAFIFAGGFAGVLYAGNRNACSHIFRRQGSRHQFCISRATSAVIREFGLSGLVMALDPMAQMNKPA
jgi:hypothetical protein